MRIIGKNRGDAAPSSSGDRPRGPRRGAVVAGFVASGLISASVVVPGVAAAAVPAAPDNLLVFVNRDFITVEGYQNHVGDTGTVQVLRGTQVIGSAQGVVEAGDVAFEVNHPGGYCWGAGTGLNVTPDIKPGDKVTLSFDGAVVGDTTVLDAAVDTKATASGSTVTVTGKVGAGVDPAQLEQRVVNPNLTGTSVARRDIRAVPGPVVPSPKGSYNSGLSVANGTATATYQFTGPDAAAVAAEVAKGGGERMMSWQVQDPAGNRQGMTIAELGEAGGPGMGGCPAGPGQQGAPTPGQATVARSADKTQLQGSWTPATPAPGAAAVTGYAGDGVAATTGTAGEQGGLLKRLPASATGATFTGLTPAESYTVEVRSLTGVKMSDPFVANATGGTSPGTPGGTPDATFGKPTASPAPTAPVTLTNAADGQDADIYYTTDGSEPRFVDVPAATATRYTGPIAITVAGTTLKFAAFKNNGSFSDTGSAGPFQPGGAPAGPSAPGGVKAAAGPELATVSWAAPATPPTKFVVTATPSTGGAPVTVEAGGNATSVQVKPLVGGTTYAVTVAAASATVTGPASAPVTVTPLVNTTPQVSISSARWKARDFRVVGTTSAPAGTAVQVRTGSATGTVISTGSVTAGAAGAPNDFSVRDRSGNPPSNPGQVWVTVGSGSAGPFTVANG